MEALEYALKRVLNSFDSGVLQDLKYEIKEEVDTKIKGNEELTIITHWIEATISGRVMPNNLWIESGYTAENAHRHKEMIIRGRDRACLVFIKYLMEYGVQKLQESVIWEWEDA